MTGDKREDALGERVDDLSCDPSKWSFGKLCRERRNGMPAVMLEWERRATLTKQETEK